MAVTCPASQEPSRWSAAEILVSPSFWQTRADTGLDTWIPATATVRGAVCSHLDTWMFGSAAWVTMLALLAASL